MTTKKSIIYLFLSVFFIVYCCNDFNNNVGVIIKRDIIIVELKLSKEALLSADLSLLVRHPSETRMS